MVLIVNFIVLQDHIGCNFFPCLLPLYSLRRSLAFSSRALMNLLTLGRDGAQPSCRVLLNQWELATQANAAVELGNTEGEDLT